VVDTATKSSLPAAGNEYEALVAKLLIAPPLAGYTRTALAAVLIKVIRIPATAVGNATPAPESTVLVTLIIFVNAVALPCTVPAADTAAFTEDTK
jgi:hypothetical protein